MVGIMNDDRLCHVRWLERGGHPKFSRKSQTFAKLKNSRHQINGARREEGGNFHTSLYIFRMSILASLWLKIIEKVAKIGMSEPRFVLLM